jgi:ribosomal protein L37AE/L43A
MTNENLRGKNNCPTDTSIATTPQGEESDCSDGDESTVENRGYAGQGPAGESTDNNHKNAGKIPVCPDCDKTNICPSARSQGWYCKDCGATFADPVERERRDESGLPSEATQRLDDMEPEEFDRLVTDGGSRLRCASCRATVTLDDTLKLQAPEISNGAIARVRVCEGCRPDAGNKCPVTAYTDLLAAVIKRANGIEEEQTTLGDAEIMTDGGSIVEDQLPENITTVPRLGGHNVIRCQTCGSEDATLEALEHRAGCPDDEGGGA